MTTVATHNTLAMQSRTSLMPLGRIITWGIFALVLAFGPQILGWLTNGSSLALNMLSQMGYLIIICLSYNMILGQGGMLSFGHAVYTGLGGFAAIHAINWATDHASGIPLPVMPLFGGLAGAFMAFLLGYVSTKKAGTTFAMITLGIGELVAAIAMMFPAAFGGEGGITTDRMYGSFLGLNFGSDLQMYYLIAVYCFVCTALMYAFTCTPLGRMLNAVRDNPERVEFIGYNTQRVRWYAFIFAGFFAGIGGALATINFEIVNAADALSGIKSGGYLLFTFLGGATVFFGPMIGAVLMVLASVLLSEFTKAWLLYLGLIFLLMVMYAPGGVASLIMGNVRMAHFGKLDKRICALYLGMLVAGVAMFAGVCVLIEMIYHVQLETGMGPVMQFHGWQFDTSKLVTWLGALAPALIGGALLEILRRQFVRHWGRAQEAIEIAIQQQEHAA